MMPKKLWCALAVNKMLPIRCLHFSFRPPSSWEQDILSIGFRLRGSLGLSLKQACCFFNPHQTPCLDCSKRPHCHYGQAFETPQHVMLEGVGKVGCLPHTWALSLHQQGLYVHAKLTLVGIALAYEASWQQSIEQLPFSTTYLPATWQHDDFSHDWQGMTPVRLRLHGKIPDETGIAQAVVHSIVNKSRMLAAMHGQQTPDAFMPEPQCTQIQWCEASRHACRTGKKQSMSGWLFDLQWSNDMPEAWQPYLNIILALGIGRQTSFGLGAFQHLPNR